MSVPNDARMQLAVEAIRGAMASIQVALHLLGEIRAGQVAQQEQEKRKSDPLRPAMYGATQKGAEPRPTTAEGADNTTQE